MSFLPIIQRELRAASRRKATYRVRWWTAGFAVLVGLVFVVLAAFQGGSATGQILFQIITGLSLVICLISGVLLTADCVSQEKRDGTLGLLFLTDLTGYDVVLGKFVATSISAFYALFALLPVAGVSLLLGSVTGAEFWRTALALINALFVSLSVGMLVSAMGRDSRNTMGTTLGLVLVLSAALPLTAKLLSDVGVSDPWIRLSWISPFTPFQLASANRYSANAPSDFSPSLLASCLLGCVFLGSASWVLPRRWQQDSMPTSRQAFWKRWLFGDNRALEWTSRKAALWLSSNPILWLLGHEPAMTRIAWFISAAWFVTVIILSWFRLSGVQEILSAAKGAGFLLKLLFATQAARFFSEARRTGMLEMLLSTPLRNRDLLRGQWLALRRVFFWPFCAYLVANFAPSTLRAIRILVSDDPNFADAIFGSAVGLMGMLWVAVGFLADIAAAGWFGMWLGLTAKKPALAPALTALIVVIIPSPFSFCALDLVFDFVLILWAVSRLNEDLRWILAPRSSRLPQRTYPIITPPGVPPPIAAQ